MEAKTDSSSFAWSHALHAPVQNKRRRAQPGASDLRTQFQHLLSSASPMSASCLRNSVNQT
eukprot:scaffold276228_cov18-Tisochrysis_lutea.AAC.1